MTSLEKRVTRGCRMSDSLLEGGGGRGRGRGGVEEGKKMGGELERREEDREGETRLHFSPPFVSIQRYCCRKCSSIIS